MAQLNPFQQQCVSVLKNLLIIACPGSGKTTVLTHRAKYILTEIPSSSVLAVTFTKDAAQELKERMIGRVKNGASKIGAGTFHSLSKTLLQRNGYQVNLLSENEARTLISDIVLTTFPNRKEAPKLQVVNSMISEIQSSINPHSYVEKYPPEIQAIFNQYEKIKQDSDRMDFSDLIHLAVREMKAGRIRPFKASHVLGDEAQDMDEVQHAWMKCHAEYGSQITLVADDDQCIYSFRQASGYEGLQRFLRELKAEQKTLPVNYRCGRKILAAAASVIENNNPKRVDKDIQAGRNTDGQIIVYEPFREIDSDGNKASGEEYDFVAEQIYHYASQYYKGEPQSVCEWAILSRTNSQLTEMEVYLREWNIPFERKQGSIWNVPIATHYAAILKYLAMGSSEWFGMSLYVKQFFDSQFLFSPDVNSLISLYKMEVSNGASELEMKELKNLIFMEKRWKEFLNQNGIDTSVNLCVEDVRDFMLCNVSDKYSEKKKEFLEMVLDSCCNALIRREGLPLKQRIFKETMQFGDKSKRIKESMEVAKNELKPFVHLLTLHGSKGLEFDNVAMISCEDDSFLSEKQDGTFPDPKEERRLFYVGMTRARHLLMMTESLGNAGKEGLNSGFLTETGVKNTPIGKRLNDVA